MSRILSKGELVTDSANWKAISEIYDQDMQLKRKSTVTTDLTWKNVIDLSKVKNSPLVPNLTAACMLSIVLDYNYFVWNDCVYEIKNKKEAIAQAAKIVEQNGKEFDALPFFEYTGLSPDEINEVL